MVDGLKTYGNEEINKKFEGKTPVFICTIATTDTSKIHGISGAGASEELNMYTPAADVEIMKYGAPHCMEEIPETVSEGEAAPTPSMLTKACLDLTGCDLEVVDAGCSTRSRIIQRTSPASRPFWHLRLLWSFPLKKQRTCS